MNIQKILENAGLKNVPQNDTVSMSTSQLADFADAVAVEAREIYQARVDAEKVLEISQLRQQLKHAQHISILAQNQLADLRHSLHIQDQSRIE